MSDKNFNRWLLFMFIFLMACVWWLVLVDMTKASTLHVLQVKNDCGACMTVKSDILQSAHNTVQKTQSSAQLHRLSDGVEMLPVDMLRYGVLDVSRTEYTGDYGLECVYNCGNYALLLDGLGRVNGGYRN